MDKKNNNKSPLERPYQIKNKSVILITLFCDFTPSIKAWNRHRFAIEIKTISKRQNKNIYLIKKFQSYETKSFNYCF